MQAPRTVVSTTPPTSRLVLGSSSPRRRELLTRAGIAFDVEPADIDERQRPGEDPRALAERLACEKAQAVARRLGSVPARWVLGADTIVVLDDDVLGKPVDAQDAARLLGRLVGRTHRVLTAVALVDSVQLTPSVISVESRVRMRPAEREEILRYVATGEPLDKAGAYAAQGEGRRFIEAIDGSESNVIGLPLDETVALLRDVGFDGRS
jgi:septum formation protein